MYIIDTFNKITFDGLTSATLAESHTSTGGKRFSSFRTASVLQSSITICLTASSLPCFMMEILVYHPKITNDVIGGLTPCRARNVLKKIANLSQNDLTELRNPLDCSMITKTIKFFSRKTITRHLTS